MSSMVPGLMRHSVKLGSTLGLMAARRHYKNPSKKSSSAYIAMDSVLVPYIGEDGKRYISSQPKISPARRPQRPSNAPEVIEIPNSGYTISEMIQTFEARQTLHEEEFRRPSQQPAVPRHGATNHNTEETNLFVIKRFVSLADAILGHYQELAMGDLPEASRKTDFPTLIREYCIAQGVLGCLVHEQQTQTQEQGQTGSCLALLEFHSWLRDFIRSFLHTEFGQIFADLIPEQHVMNPAQSLGPHPAVEYVEQILDACLINITDAAATSREIRELLTLQSTLKAALPPSMSQSIVHYIGALVNAVCNHVASRTASIQSALESHVH